MDEYFNPAKKAIANYGKLRLISLIKPGTVNFQMQIGFSVPIHALETTTLQITELLATMKPSLIIPTGVLRTKAIALERVDAPKKSNGGKATQWSMLLKPAASENDVNSELVKMLVRHVDAVMGRGCGTRFCTDFVIALSFHEDPDITPGIFSDTNDVLHLVNNEYAPDCIDMNAEPQPAVVPALDDGRYEIEESHARLGKKLEGHLIDAIEVDDEEAYNSDIDSLLDRADEAFAPAV